MTLIKKKSTYNKMTKNVTKITIKTWEYKNKSEIVYVNNTKISMQFINILHLNHLQQWEWGI